MRKIGRVAAVVGLVLVAVAVGTYLAGEQVEVAVLRTVDADGSPHDTKLWVVELDGTPWVRVARPERRWFVRLRAHPEVELVRGGRTARYRAVPRPEARERADDAFAAKYGAVDWWYGILLRSHAIPVQLVPAGG